MVLDSLSHLGQSMVASHGKVSKVGARLSGSKDGHSSLVLALGILGVLQNLGSPLLVHGTASTLGLEHDLSILVGRDADSLAVHQPTVLHREKNEKIQ